MQLMCVTSTKFKADANITCQDTDWKNTCGWSSLNKTPGGTGAVLENTTPEDTVTCYFWKMGDNREAENEWDEFFAENVLQNCCMTLASRK